MQMKMKLVLLDRDETFLNRLTSALGSREDCAVEIYSFTDLGQALGAMEKAGNCLFAVSDEFDSVIDPGSLPEGVCFAWLTESRSVSEHRGIAAICKFQKAEMIFREILSVFSGSHSGIGGRGTCRCSLRCESIRVLSLRRRIRGIDCGGGMCRSVCIEREKGFVSEP